jgi:hypothetical protein
MQRTSRVGSCHTSDEVVGWISDCLFGDGLGGASRTKLHLNRVRSHTVEAANHLRFLLHRGHDRMCKSSIQYDTTTTSSILHLTHRNIGARERPHHSISASQPWSPESHQSPHRRSRARPRNHRPNSLHSRNSRSADLSKRAQIPAWPSWPQCWVSSWNENLDVEAVELEPKPPYARRPLTFPLRQDAGRPMVTQRVAAFN